MGVASYAELNEYKSKIRALCDSTGACLDEFGKIYYNYKFDNVEGLKNLISKIGQANFKVIVIGKFSTGKSSLINSLLGDYVLPDSLSPCTAYINEIVYGEEKQATIYFKNPLPEDWADFVKHEGVRAHIEKHCKGAVPEFVIPLDELEDCVTIPWDEDSDDVIEENTDFDISPFAKAVIQYPCELCRNGIEIIDSPGLDESRDRTEIVDKYLNKVDAVIYVMTNVATGGDSDKEIIDKYLTQNDIKNVFFVCNLFGIPLKKAQKQISGRLKKIFGDKTLLGDRGIHLVNIRDMQNTGVQDFEQALADYLNNDKGMAQLNAYLEQLTKLNTAIKSEAAAFACVADVDLVAIDKAIAANKARIANGQQIFANSKAIIEAINQAIDQLCRNEVMEKFKKLSYSIRMDIRDRNDAAKELSGNASEAETRALAEKLAQEYAERFENDFRGYSYEELTLSIIEEINSKLLALQAQADDFAKNLAVEENCFDLQALSPVAEIAAKGFAGALVTDFASFVAYTALNLEKVLDNVVKDVFVVCAGYQEAIRGAKMTAEIQNRVSLEVYQKLERLKRSVVEYLIAGTQQALANLEFNKVVQAMETAIVEQQNRLAAKEQQRLAILAQQEEEHNRSNTTLKQLDDNLDKLAVLQKELAD